jgi:WD40 repeat protein
MRARFGCLALVTGLTLSHAYAEPKDALPPASRNAARAETPARTDLYGDPLPPGVVARLGSVRLRDLNNFFAFAFSPDSRTVAAGNQHAALWDLQTGRRLRVFDAKLYCLAFSPDGKTLVTAYNEVRLWDVATGKERQQLTGHQHRVHAVAFSPDGKTLAGGDEKGSIVLWEMATGRVRTSVPGPGKCIMALAFAADGKHLAVTEVGSTNSKIHYHARLLEWATHKELRRIPLDAASWHTLAPDGRYVADPGNGTITSTPFLWELGTGRKRPLFDSKKWWPDVSFSLDGKTLVAGVGIWDQAAELWDVDTGKLQRRLRLRPQLESRVRNALLLSPDGKILAGSENDSDLGVWDAVTGERRLTFPGHTLPIQFLAYSPDGRRLFSEHGREGVFCWEVATGRLLSRSLIPGGPWENHCFQVSPDGTRVALGAHGVRLWSLDAPKKTCLLKDEDDWISCVAYSPDGKQVAAGGSKLFLREADTGRLVRTLDLPNREDSVFWVAFAPDGRRLAAGGFFAAHLWY